MRFYRFLFFVSIALVVTVAGCRKDRLLKDPGAKLRFSTDTLTFDTVFTTVGSAVRSFVIYNDANKPVELSSLRIAGGENSIFRLNVDGMPGKVFTNVRIEAKDSIYVFAAVTVDPTSGVNPFVVEDKVLFDLNGNEQSIALNAWGQDAYFHYGETLQNDSIWPNDKPHVVIHSFLVDSLKHLTIQQGTRVYMHGNSGLFVKGTLTTNGTKEDSVIFQGDRLEPYFKDLPGNWGYIRFLRFSHDNVLTHTIVKDALYGVIVDSLSINANPKVTLTKCTVKNMFNSGMRAASGSVRAENCLVYNCGDYCAELFYGGDYSFKHCTFANYGSTTISHQKPTVLLTNYYTFDHVNYVYPFLSAQFTNCILYGSLEKELAVDSIGVGGSVFNYQFKNCLIRTTESLPSPQYDSCINNQDPQFVNASDDVNDSGNVTAAANFHLNDNSPAINAGNNAAGVTDDLDDKPRDGQPDIGCYEK